MLSSEQIVNFRLPCVLPPAETNRVLDSTSPANGLGWPLPEVTEIEGAGLGAKIKIVSFLAWYSSCFLIPQFVPHSMIYWRADSFLVTLIEANIFNARFGFKTGKLNSSTIFPSQLKESDNRGSKSNLTLQSEFLQIAFFIPSASLLSTRISNICLSILEILCISRFWMFIGDAARISSMTGCHVRQNIVVRNVSDISWFYYIFHSVICVRSAKSSH